MKPCSENRKNLALLAANALDAVAAGKLREHIGCCSACQDYFAELSGVAGRLSQAKQVSEVEASDRFHQKLAGRIRATESQSLGAYFAEVLLKARILIPAAGAFLLIGIIAASVFHSSTRIQIPSTGNTPAVATATVTADISPTFANYQNAANQSFDQLDSLLTRQAREGLPAAQIYTASTTSLPQGSL